MHAMIDLHNICTHKTDRERVCVPLFAWKSNLDEMRRSKFDAASFLFFFVKSYLNVFYTAFFYAKAILFLYAVFRTSKTDQPTCINFLVAFVLISFSLCTLIVLFLFLLRHSLFFLVFYSFKIQL